MKVKIELFGASRDFSNKNYLDFDVGKNSTIKDIRNKLINYLEEEFNGNENFKKIVKLSAFCSEDNNIVSKKHTIQTINQTKIGLSAFDSKRYLLDDGVNTLAQGHYKIKC